MQHDPSATPPIPLLVLTTAESGGAERVLSHLVEQLPARGFEPVLLLLAPGPLATRLATAGFRDVHVADSADGVRDLARSLIDKTGARLVLSNKSSAHRHGGYVARERGLPAVWWQQDVARPTPPQLRVSGFRADAIVCASDLVLAAQQLLTPSANLVKIPLGAPVDSLVSRAGSGALIRAQLGWPDAPLVGTVGRVTPFKRQRAFVEAAALIARQRPDVRFLVIGQFAPDDPYCKRVLALTHTLGVADRIQFVGHQDDIAPWFDALDVLVHPTAGEPFGLVIVEAMAMGTPVVATGAGGPSEILEHERTGLLVPPEVPPLTAQAVLRLLTEPDLRARLAAAGRQRALTFTIERMTTSFVALLSRLIEAEPIQLR